MTLASLSDVSVSRGGRPILRDVSLSLPAGEILAVVGPNGAGKSTLVGAFAGDLPVTAGTVTVDGRPVDQWRPRELALRRSVLPQHTAVAFPFTVEQVIEMGRAPWARTPLAAEDEQAVAEAMALTEMTDFAGRTFSTLSGGERARAALARVLAQRTPILLLDEPTAALDLRHQDLVLTAAANRAATGCAVLAVLHDLNLAAAYADQVAVVADGRVRACGPPSTVLTSELLTEVYHREVEVMAHPRSGTPLVLPVR
ncbi:iron complex transport system ATP-binding protein [Herbihabitans rhizosphaerae]|uniref:Iron complex transport system ATP-binding protein n=1 Tax=Herbihabitans rhizosphaerae TaxID=1872711 RepID=A0A4Q7L5T0_9PSEU|nr:heme ABC transporter ATP-binding protein [Herbihabitans rhizosphaerae]RZS44606.1 iron complex transport system ATP-binding protein [Herbihabitans rhizosphaerae]